MSKKNVKPGFIQKISQYFKFLCSSEMKEDKSQNDLKQRRSTIRKRRLTFMLDETTVKLSRKNINLQEFHGTSYISSGLEKHLSHRLNGLTFVQFQGGFTDKSMRSVVYPLKLITKQASVFNPANQILINPICSYNFRQNMVQCLVYQLKHYQYDLIATKLKHYHNKISHFVFVMEKQIQTKEFHQLFTTFKNVYLFQIERVMEMDKCIATVAYISRSAQFLKIDTESMVNFYIAQLLKRGTYIQKFDFSQLLTSLLAADLYVEVASILGELSLRKNVSYFDRQFIKIIEQRYPMSRQIINPFRQSVKNEQKEDAIHIHENTPLFGGIKVSFRLEQKQKSEDDKVTVKSKKSIAHSFGSRHCVTEWQ